MDRRRGLEREADRIGRMARDLDLPLHWLGRHHQQARADPLGPRIEDRARHTAPQVLGEGTDEIVDGHPPAAAPPENPSQPSGLAQGDVETEPVVTGQRLDDQDRVRTSRHFV